ncbi:MAG: NUDIX hydrolase [bacterium]
MLKTWPALHTEKISENRVFSLIRRRARSPRTGLDHDFFLLTTPTWINIVPITRSGELVLVRQYRQGVEDFTLEIPGGMMDPRDGAPEDAAARELLEETGYRAARLLEMGWVEPNPAIQDTRCHTFLAEDVERVAPIDQDGGEDLEVVLVPLSEVGELVRCGRIRHALVIAAFALTFGIGDVVR